jgi:lysocardiolipin and lysophospholipid acyltransferase
VNGFAPFGGGCPCSPNPVDLLASRSIVPLNHSQLMLSSRLVFPALLLTALIGSVHLILPAAIVLLPVYRCTSLESARTAYRAAVRFVARAWFSLAAALLERESEVIVTGDVPASEDQCVLLICNHHCRVDWMFLWVLVARYGTAGSLKIALKDSMRAAPFFGWAMQAFLFVFLSRRDRERDLALIRSTLRYIVHTLHEPITFLLFPEGTDLSPSNLDKARAWATARGVPPFEHLLQPRSGGFIEAVRVTGDGLDALYDVTILYAPRAQPPSSRHEPPVNAAGGDSLPSDAPWRPSEVEMMGGRFPGTVRMHMRRFDRSELPVSDEALAAWLQDRWAEKEALLASTTSLRPPNPAADPPTAEYSRWTRFWILASGLVLVGFTIVPVLWLPTLVGCALLWAATRFAGGLGAIEMAAAPEAKPRAEPQVHRSSLSVPLV